MKKKKSNTVEDQHGLTPAPNSFAGCPSRPQTNDNGSGKYLSVPGKSTNTLNPGNFQIID